jgi:hypothetical protein
MKIENELNLWHWQGTHFEMLKQKQTFKLKNKYAIVRIWKQKNQIDLLGPNIINFFLI